MNIGKCARRYPTADFPTTLVGFARFCSGFALVLLLHGV